jgi:hypothetical protein
VAGVEPGEYTLTVLCDRNLLQVFSKPTVIRVE